MDVLMVIVMIGIFAWVFFIISRVDKFINKDGFSEGIEGKRKMGILIFGSDEATNEARKEGIQYTRLTKPVLPKDDDYYSAILILSKNETENLALCEAVYEYDPDIYIIVRCGDHRMKAVYEKLGADRVIMPDESTKMLLDEIWRVLK